MSAPDSPTTSLTGFRIPYTPRQLAALAAASSDRRQFAKRLRPVFSVAGKDVTARAEECVYKGEDGIAVVLEATLAGRLPTGHEQKDCRVDWIVSPPEEAGLDPEELAGFSGKVISVKRGRYSTRLVAATSGYESSRTPIGEGPADDREYSKTRPDTALYDLLSGLPYAGLELGGVSGPSITKRGADRYPWTMYRKAAVEDIEGEARVAVRDLAVNVAALYRVAPVDRQRAPVWEIEETRDTEEVGDDTPEGERYARVRAYREAEGGGAGGEHSPAGVAEIDNRGHAVYNGSAYMMSLSSEDNDEGFESAYSEAVRQGRNDAGISAELAYPPFFLSRGEELRATLRGNVEDHTLLEHFLFRMDAFNVDVLGIKGSVSGEGAPVGVERVRTAKTIFPRTGGVLRPLWGRDTDGGPFVNEALPWVAFDAKTGEGIVYPGVAERSNVTIFYDEITEEVVARW